MSKITNKQKIIFEKLDTEKTYSIDEAMKIIQSVKSEKFDEKTEESFKYLQIFTAICDSFSHGANDVANAIGPYAAIVSIYMNEGDLEKNVDFYYKSEQIYLRPNELLDREEFTEGNYTLQFDFIKRYQGEDSEPIYISEISPSRKEIRLKSKDIETSPRINDVLIANYLNQTNTDNPLPNQYKFNTFVEVSGGLLIPINNYAFDKVTDGEDGVSTVSYTHLTLPTKRIV